MKMAASVNVHIRFLLTILIVYFCSADVSTDVNDQTGCKLEGYDVSVLTAAAVWELNVTNACYSADDSGSLQNCSILLAFCHEIKDVDNCNTSSACQQSQDNSTYSLGEYASSPFASAGTFGFHAILTGGTPAGSSVLPCNLNMKITFTCDPNASWMLVGNFSVVPKPSFLHYTPSNCTYLMQLPYDGACYSMPTAAPIPSSSSTGISVGSILLIVFFTGSISYLILGCVFNYSNGAVGRELWPHYEFWVDLPELIKDGFIFTFKVLTCTDAHLGPQYEAI